MAYVYGFSMIVVGAGIAALNTLYRRKRRKMTPAEREFDDRDSYHL